MRPLLTTVIRALRWHRRLVAAACAALAVFAILNVLTSRDDAIEVIAADRDLPGGQAFAAGDLITLRLPADAVPAGALTSAAEAVGRTAAAPVPARGVLTTSDLLTGGTIVEDGRVALPVTFDSSSPVELLRVSDSIDLLGAGPAGSMDVVATAVRVAALPELESGGLFGSGGSRIVLLDLAPSEAARVTAAAAASPLAFALRS